MNKKVKYAWKKTLKKIIHWLQKKTEFWKKKKSKDRIKRENNCWDETNEWIK